MGTNFIIMKLIFKLDELLKLHGYGKIDEAKEFEADAQVQKIRNLVDQWVYIIQFLLK